MPTHNSRGMVLFVTIWILTILTVFVLGIGFRMSLEVRMAEYNVRKQKNLYLAKAALNTLMAAVLDDENLEYDSLNEDWSDNESLFRDVALKEGAFTISYKRLEGPAEKTFYGAKDEESKINVNTVPREVLLNLPGVTEEIADSMLDWVDANTVSRRGGDEDSYYNGLPYSCKNAPFESLEELLLVDGMTPEILNGLKDLITVYGEYGGGAVNRVNLNTAGSGVMEALGLSRIIVDKILNTRAGGDGEEGTPDDIIFTSVSDIIHKSGLTDSEAMEINNLHAAGLIGVSSRHFRARIIVRPKGGKPAKTVEAVVRRSDKGAEVKYWNEY